jgi:hypothetical protein
MTGHVATWPGSIAACLEASDEGFVAVVPQDDDMLESCLLELQAAVRSQRLVRLTLLFADGIRAAIQPGDRFRFWRRDSTLLEGDSG